MLKRIDYIVLCVIDDAVIVVFVFNFSVSHIQVILYSGVNLLV